MPYTPPTVNYSTTINGAYTTLTGVQSVSINRGRQRFQDPFPPTNCTIELIPATTYATPLAVGQFIDVRDTNSGSSPAYFVGLITDVTRTYAIPYNSGTGYAPGDRITITAAGPVGLVGSASVNNLQVFNAFESTEAAQRIAENSNVFCIIEPSSILVSGTFASGPSLEYVNNYLQTGQLLIDDLDTSRGAGTGQFVFIYNNRVRTSGAFVYSDTGQTRYKQLEYQSSQQSTFNYVEVDPDAFSPQVTKAVSGPYNSLIYKTFNYTAADALNLSGYLYNLLSGQLTPVPFRLGTDTDAAPNCMDVVKVTKATVYQPAIGQLATIVFRGTTVTAQIQGFNANFGIDSASVQIYFSPSLGVPFTLDSSTNGVLNQNRLGL
jgi:hypothetical protein